jgi:hypothetical protein
MPEQIYGKHGSLTNELENGRIFARVYIGHFLDARFCCNTLSVLQ